MSLFKSLKAYLALNKLQKRLLKKKQLRGSYSQQAWISLLGGLADYDEHSDKLRRFSGIAFFVLMIPTFFSGAFPPLLLITVPIWLATGVLWLLTRKMDLSNHLRVFIMPFITLIGDDIKAGQTLSLNMDLRGGDRKDKSTGRKEPYKKGAYYKIVETLYEDPWLSGEAVLSDGSRLQFHLRDAIRKLKKTKRTARGKIKTKTKYKIKGLMDIQLKLPVNSYRLRDAQNTPAGIKLDVKPGEKWISLRARTAVARDGEKLQEPELRPMLDLLTRLYTLAERKPEGEVNHA